MATPTYISYGQLHKRDPNYGLWVICYVCDTAHKARGIAVISDKPDPRVRPGDTCVPLCRACLHGKHRRDGVIRKYWNLPDLEITEVTPEQGRALAEKQDATSH